MGKCLFFKDVAYIMFTIFQYTKLSCRPIYQQWTIESGIKKTIPFTIASKKDKTLRNKLKQGVEKFYTEPLRHWQTKFKKS